MELLARIQRGEIGTVVDSYFQGEKIHLIVDDETGDIVKEPIFKGSSVTRITPSMEDVFVYLVKEQSGKKLEGGRMSGSGEATIKIKNDLVLRSGRE